MFRLKFLLLLSLLFSVEALQCWVCENAINNADCLENGRMQRCQDNQNACQNEVRRGSDGLRVTKRCKQEHACDNNFIQNPKAAWAPTQCNSRTPSSVCRCCCNFDECNRDQLECLGVINGTVEQTFVGFFDETPFCEPLKAPRFGRMACSPQQQPIETGALCVFRCLPGYEMRGAQRSKCILNQSKKVAVFSRPPPTCEPKPCPILTAPRNGSMSCSNENRYASICAFTCENGYVLEGSLALRCRSNEKWNRAPPSCVKPQCQPPPEDLLHGSVTCTDGHNADSECRFTCNFGYALIGTSMTKCVYQPSLSSLAQWNNEPPVCKEITCPVRHEPGNGAASCTTGQNLGSFCVFACDEGYFLEGEVQSICLDDFDDDADGVWSSPVPSCLPKTCDPPHVAPGNGSVTCENENYVGYGCNFVCDEGFALEGSHVSMCLDDVDSPTGDWSEQAPICTPIMCQPLGELENGEVICTNTLFHNSICAFSCNRAYLLDGPEISECLNGTWNNPLPTCNPLTCSPSHTAPDSGTVSCSDNSKIDSECIFICDEGHSLVGLPQSTCLITQDWDSPAPVCAPIACPERPPVENGKTECTDENAFGSICMVTCNEHYELEGEMQSTCLDKKGDPIGMWSMPLPSCQVLPCFPPHSPPDGGSILCSDSNNVDGVCSFSCDDGRALVGEPESTCLVGQRWSSLAPRCLPITCLIRPPVENGRTECSDGNAFGSVCEVLCDRRYELEGEEQSQCLDDDGDQLGTWSALLPSCKALLCEPAHSSQDNGSVSCSDNNKIDSVCSFTCDIGHALVGRQQSTCLITQNWSSPPPVCIPIVCPNRSLVINGRTTCTNENAVGSVCTVVCIERFGLDGEEQSMCLDDNGDPLGSWSAPLPTCNALRCAPSLAAPDSGSVSCSDSNKIDSICSFTCDEGHSIMGQSQPTCLITQNWSSPAPICIPIVCSGRPPVPNGRTDCTNDNAYGSVCTVVCDDQFERVGEEQYKCTDENSSPLGVWNKPSPSCDAMTCEPSHSSPDNGKLSCSDSNKIESVCSFTCDEGHSLMGQPQSTCLSNRNWDIPAPICIPIVCPNRLPVPNGSTECTDETAFGSICIVTCDEHYELVGEERSKCVDDNGDPLGIWDEALPTCIAMTCEPAHSSPDSGSVSCSDSNKIHSVCSFTCDVGHSLMGQPQSTCFITTDWSSPAPVCSPITCPSLLPVLNGRIRCSEENAFGSICEVVCDEHYELVGEEQVMCIDDNSDPHGVWSNPLPSCVARRCAPEHSTPENGNVSCSDSNKIDSVCSFTCDVGQSLVGQPQSTCLITQDWSSPTPTCLPIICSSRPPVANGRIECTDNNAFESVCIVVCDENYELVGKAQSNCLDDNGDPLGVWSEPLPQCKALRCAPEHLSPDSGKVSCSDSNKIDSICSFTCDEGHSLIGQSQATCLMGQEWEYPAPACTPIVCENRLLVPNGSTECSDGTALGSVCIVTCNRRYELEGAEQATCIDDDADPFGVWTAPVPSCNIRKCMPHHLPPDGGSMLCSDRNNVDSACSFTCADGHTLEGQPQSTCFITQDWSSPAPTCTPIICQSLPPLQNGRSDCTEDGALGSVCDFICDEGFALEGEIETTCLDDDGDRLGVWSNPLPTCREIVCNPLTPLQDGNVSCSSENRYNSVCSFRCDEERGFELYPTSLTQTVCLDDTTWSLPQPCCARSCPPYAHMDLVIVLDSSSSIFQENWVRLKAFGRRIIESFIISSDVARISVFRYNRRIDRRSQILLKDFPEDKEGLLRAYDAIPYNGKGTKTGQAIQHVTRVILTEENGDRPDVTDVVLVITDGRSQDEVDKVSAELREHGALTYAIGVVPRRGRLDMDQLMHIAGSSDHLLIAESGFTGLDGSLSHKITENICTNRCVEGFDSHGHVINPENFDIAKRPATPPPMDIEIEI
ncbi:unnamed protein product [Clavelina lepadiformis]|uniref:Uncharacterized protein n=1 Tax=Clavelina lepadiformis TaxID=159417 RepID=A0ABP0H0K6_CLALP